MFLVKYEELATRPNKAIPRLLKVCKVHLKNLVTSDPLQFLNLPWHPAMTQFMADHMVDDPE